MKFQTYLTTFLLAATLASCDSPVPSSDCFGDIPATLAKYETEAAELKNEATSGNYEKTQQKGQKLKAKVTAEIEETAQALNGKVIKVSIDSEILKTEESVTLVFVGMNHLRPIFSLDGKVVASRDLTLNAAPSDLEGDLLHPSSDFITKVNLPVKLDFLDKNGNAVEAARSGHDIGLLPAEIIGSSAIVKAGTILDFTNHQFVVDDQFEGIESLRLVVDLSKEPYITRELKQ